MSTSNKTDSAAESTSSNVSKEITVEKDAGKDGTELMKLKESKFYELIDWLKKWGYETKDTTKENKTEGIEFQAQVSPQLPYSSGLSTPFFLEFQKDLDDGFIIRTTFELDKNIESQITGKELDLTYIELDSLVLPKNISMIKSPPLINLYKVIFYDGLSKQFFLDAVTALISSMSIVIGKWNQKSHEKSQQADSAS
ncbi:MAG: hypothetical protein P0116_03565 [Candidatus Nitrosocosmicus sp.]|nr:hypothetical protein [Candidatus Nitrosocosmicus sp.]